MKCSQFSICINFKAKNILRIKYLVGAEINVFEAKVCENGRPPETRLLA